MSEEDFRARLAAFGIVLDRPAFSAAFKGAQHLRSEVAKINSYLDQKT